MNEQIEKLFDQALEEFKAENKYATIVVPDPLQRDFVEKFAELIVRECSLVIRNGGYRKGAFGDEDLRPSEIATMIEEHFGVEE